MTVRSAAKQREYTRKYMRERRQRDPGMLKYRHDMQLSDWNAMWEAQGGKCYLCQQSLPKDPTRVHVDHDHSCCRPTYSCAACRRGLACGRCNQAIGLAGDDPAKLRAMADALELAQAAAAARIAAKPEQLQLCEVNA